MRVTFINDYKTISKGTSVNLDASLALNLLAEGYVTINDFSDYPDGNPATVQVRLTRPAGVVQYTAGDMINSSVATPVALDLPNFGLANGKGAWITGIVATTNLLNLANSTIRLWLYRTTPTLVGDNVAMTNSDANTTIGRTYIDITFNSLLAGSAVLIGQVYPMMLYQCDASHNDIQVAMQTLATFTPVSGGFVDLAFTLLQNS